MPLSFKAKIEIIGVNPYVLVSAERAKKLHENWKKPMPVLVQINGVPNPAWKINMMPIGDGSFYLYLAGIVRKASKTKVGDTVQVDVSFDENYKSGPMPTPEWFSEKLNKNKKALESWNKLIPSRQKEILRYLSNLKSEEARVRNIEKAIRVLSGSSERYMARSWKDGK